MEIVEFNVNGKKCGLFFNLTVYMEICAHFGGIDEMFEKIVSDSEPIETFLWLASALMKGAAANAKLNGEELHVFTVEELAAVYTPYDIGKIRKEVFKAVSGKASVDIEVNDSKNAEATVGTI